MSGFIPQMPQQVPVNQVPVQNNPPPNNQSSGLCSTIGKVTAVFAAIVVSVVSFIFLKPLFAGLIAVGTLGALFAMLCCCSGSSSSSIGRTHNAAQGSMSFLQYLNPTHYMMGRGSRNVTNQNSGGVGAHQVAGGRGNVVITPNVPQPQTQYGYQQPPQQLPQNRGPLSQSQAVHGSRIPQHQQGQQASRVPIQQQGGQQLPQRQQNLGPRQVPGGRGNIV